MQVQGRGETATPGSSFLEVHCRPCQALAMEDLDVSPVSSINSQKPEGCLGHLFTAMQLYGRVAAGALQRARCRISIGTRFLKVLRRRVQGAGWKDLVEIYASRSSTGPEDALWAGNISSAVLGRLSFPGAGICIFYKRTLTVGGGK